MTLIVKIMTGNENAPDDDTRKQHRIITGVSDVDFWRDPDGMANITVSRVSQPGWEPETYPLIGNVYVMNESGRTVTSFGVSAIPDAHPSLLHSLDSELLRLIGGPGPVNSDELYRVMKVSGAYDLYHDGTGELIPRGTPTVTIEGARYIAKHATA